jgi:hypothetical protein
MLTELTEQQLAEIVANVQDGCGIRDAIRETIGEEPSLQLLVWLQDNHYDLLTDAKNGRGYAANQREMREAMKGHG